METWSDRKRWADQFTPNIKTILGHLFIREASVEADQRENTDLMFEMFGRRFAVRVRKIEERMVTNPHSGYLYNRRNEWTIRLTKSRGVNELLRLMAGFGDFCLYGWGDISEERPRVKGWTVFDLGEVRKWLFEYVLEKKVLPGQIQTVAGTGSFLALCIDDMPPEAIVRRQTVLPGDPEYRQADNL